jgi:hypothetical protein
MLLSTLICRRSDKPLASGMGQQAVSFCLYVGAIPMAYVSPYISLGMICLVASLLADAAKEDRRDSPTPSPAHPRTR